MKLLKLDTEIYLVVSTLTLEFQMVKKDTAKDGKKVFESKYDAVLLRKLVKAGKNADQIQHELGIASKQSLRQHILKLINEDRVFYEVPGLYVRNQKLPMINFKNEIRLTKKMIEFEDNTYAYGDKFEVDANNERIILTRLVATNNEAEQKEE